MSSPSCSISSANKPYTSRMQGSTKSKNIFVWATISRPPKCFVWCAQSPTQIWWRAPRNREICLCRQQLVGPLLVSFRMHRALHKYSGELHEIEKYICVQQLVGSLNVTFRVLFRVHRALHKYGGELHEIEKYIFATISRLPKCFV